MDKGISMNVTKVEEHFYKAYIAFEYVIWIFPVQTKKKYYLDLVCKHKQ